MNETLERHKFFNRSQQEGENFEDFLTEIKLLSRNGNFCTAENCFPSLLRDRIIGGITNDQLREKLLAEKGLTVNTRKNN